MIRPSIAIIVVLSLAPIGTMRAEGRYVLENRFLGRIVSTEGGTLRTVEIVNKRAGTSAKPESAPEFRLRLSRGTDKPDTQCTLTAADFQVTAATSGRESLAFQLENAEHQLRLEVRYELRPDDFYLRKRLMITSAQPVTLERIDVEVLRLPDAIQPYTVRQITANAPGKWSPGLGQPLYTGTSGTFWGIEFPAADNHVTEGTLVAGYLWGRELKPGQAYRAYPAVLGVADDPAFVADAFQEYLNRVRVRPLRLEVQYNSWFDYGGGVRRETFSNSVAKIHQELAVARGNKPLNMYVIDDGWQDTRADWSDKLWKVNSKFDPDFASSRQATARAQAKLGLWLSPGCLFGASGQVPKLRAQGFEALDNWMSMAGPRYMQALEDRMVELTRQGVGFYKLDGLFGHLNIRNFELHGAQYGLPEMPQLGLEGFTSGDKRLNDGKYDELKIYYLTAGTERLMQLFDKLATVDPNIYIVISNGAYLSPWWLMHVDTVWMINAGDAAGGSSRTEQLVYRDSRYHEIWRQQNCQFPLCSIFNHEPKKTSTGEPQDEFRRYLYMHLSRGTGFVELYIKPFVLQGGDWDVISEGLFWAQEVFPTFPRARMHGGSPQAGDVYGYTAWNGTQGYLSVHNPSATAKTYTVTLDRAFGLVPDTGPFCLSSPIEDCTRGLPATCRFGATLAFEMAPREIRILNFTTGPKDWTKLRRLQTSSPERPGVSSGKGDAPPSPVAKSDLPIGIDDLPYEQAVAKLAISYRKDLPQLFVSGDSISVGYGAALKLALKDRMNVVHRRDLPVLFPAAAPKAYSGAGPSVLQLTRTILSMTDYKPEVLLLNFGLHDTANGANTYERNLNSLVALAREKHAKLVWVQTTAKAKGHRDNPRIAEFNQISARVMAAAQVPVIDLNAFTAALAVRHGEDHVFRPDQVHFTPWAAAEQGKYLGAALRDILRL